MAEYGTPIYWHHHHHWELRPSLTESARVDVAIIGGGFTGLWTAYHLLDAEPSLSVAIIEAQELGYGGSGRNGGFAMTLLDFSLAHLRAKVGDTAAKEAHEAVARSVGEIDQTIHANNIDCEWVRGGLMVVATNAGQLGRIRDDLEAAEALDLEGFRPLSKEEAQGEIHSPTYLGGLTEEHCGVMNPAQLTHGLARVVEAMGATIYEATAMQGIDEVDGRLRVTTATGALQADQVVLAANSWAATMPWVKNRFVPLYTYVALTEPLTDKQWDTIGWSNWQGVEDKQNYVHYYRRTADGRILWGGNDGVVYWRGRIASRLDRHQAIFNGLQGTFRQTFPQLGSVRFTHHWGGPVAVPANYLPMFGTTLDGRLHYGLGYCGHGVAPSHTGGKILRDKVLGRTSEYTQLCLVDTTAPRLPPEPLRWLGAELTRRSQLAQDRRFERGAGRSERQPREPVIMRALRALTPS